MSYFDIDVYSRKVTTKSAKAQKWFDRGLVWCFAYSHEEAADCFRRALDHDPKCAMAWWGLAYAVGPNYNLPWIKRDEQMRADSLAEAYDATQAGLKLKKVTEAERALLEALTARFPQRDPAPLEVMTGWNDDFADAMRQVHHAHLGDLDVRAIFVEAIMNRTPWQMWNLQTGLPAEGAGTEEARTALEWAFENDPAAWKHPGLLHLYVHLMEMSPTPEAAMKAGDVLRDLVPDSGHLLHMPTHIDIQCGQYRDTWYWNHKASQVDRKYLDRNGVYKIYTGYRIHNYHFAVYGAMFLGQYEPALAAAQELIDVTPEDLLRVPSPPMADYFESYFAIRDHVLIRFGRWREIIDLPMPEDPALFANLTAVRHYAKGVAHAALGEVDAAEEQQRLFLATRDRVPEGRLMHNMHCHQQLAVAEEMLAGEIDYRKGHFDTGFAHLRRAIALEDALPYDEPWGWMQPTRHALGALLLEQNRVEEAEAVYREDLGLGGTLPRAQIHPDNVWSLRGLMDCLTRRGADESAEGRLLAQRLNLANARADRPVRASCFCAQAAAE
ncbi:tetratricopeptide repeat protein [Halovulum sp. GXIMD14794]